MNTGPRLLYLTVNPHSVKINENYLLLSVFQIESTTFAQRMDTMHKRIRNIWKRICCWTGLCLLLASPLTAKDFTVVLDAGHGGHDAGAVGRISKEKNINLKVALAVGRLLEQNCRDVEVVYTRKTDKFIPLHGRADVANRAQADLFVSIHTNSLPKGKIARGTETYTLGLHRTKENLAVAQKENSVILIESDYKQRYAGFNPNSAESYIMFEFIQDKNMKQSVRLAQSIQRQFRTTARRNDRGVRQAGFLVLHATSMPSVLVELGYISTPDEERYLNSAQGVSDLSRSIYNAILDYKRRQPGTSGVGEPADLPAEDSNNLPTEDVSEESESRAEPEKTPEPTAPVPSQSQTTTDAPVFKIQILTSSTRLKTNDRRLKGLAQVEYYVEGGLYKYTYGASTDYNEVYRTRKQILAKFKDAFIIAFRGNEKMNVQQAIKEFKQNKHK